ncbi:sensor histidine kinase [Paenibacillus harenae]|uniref:sensor histidine kinase n=1 Tax=Paenibacillus harenae TaxID=306543 RepID=UPI002791FE06|nr:HAMP domain-containing sensor histidine kinase [Paenibacillus harenae]MDQ0063801.1 signal transduction histidine kinase [Paenibacillus harenae]
MKPKRRLFNSLMRSYILFGFTIIVINATLGFFMKDWLTLGKAPELTAGALVRTDYENIPYDKVEAAGGRVEILDENGRIVYANGNAGTMAGSTTAYTPEELLFLLEDRQGDKLRRTLASFRDDTGKRYTLLVTLPKEGNYAQIYINFTLLMLFFLSVYLFSRWTAKHITGPLEKIVQAIQRMRDGHFNERLSFESDYELTLIQDHFNEMGASLLRTEREKKEIESGKKQMLLDLSHDLKTPITTIQGYVQALQLGMADSPQKHEEYLGIIYNKSRIVTSLIEDMFQLATLESPEYPFRSEVGDLAELIRRIAIAYYDVFKHKGFIMDVRIPDKTVNVQMNEKLVHRAVSNLLSNALQHNNAGTEVSLSLDEIESGVRLEICDNGPGIPEALKDTLFQPFKKGDSARTSSGGTGLGLAIAHKAVQLHGGTLRLREVPDKTVFEITLPI